MTARQAFREAVVSCVTHGVYPSPLAVTRERARLFGEGLRVRNELNDREMQMREDVLLACGWTKNPQRRPDGRLYRYRWVRP